MILTIRKTGGPAGTDEVLGPIDATRMDPETRHRISVQLEALADLTSSHEPSAREGARYEVEAQGPGSGPTFLIVEDTGDPGHPAVQALGTLLRTLGLELRAPSPVA
jgi:hypothetical protein